MKARVKKLVALSKYGRFDEPFVSYPDSVDVESGTRGVRHQGIKIQQSNRRRYDEDDDDDGLPTVTAVSENYLTSPSPSLPSRGGPRNGGGPAAPGPRRDSSFSSGGTGKYDEPYSPSREGSNWSSAEEGGVKVL
ncbi:hypothetical protein M407DRAFT_244663 [Tulasnella calospora MUT 4182]|uniref:Uncharacterized protein n=1 Tax=Tulasnella calospora MUT 4182 TaxID=1051891 RepID=A0A0C3QDU9_9AGAM|nr:hypothetical protein M407DRAFT_244663 [Tulasnella calospora MUT 4182]